MAEYIEKSALVAEIKRRIKTNKECMLGLRNLDYYQGKVDALNDTISFLDTLEVKDANEALRTEYEKGRADVIADTLSWLANCWPQYCSNQTIIEGFKEAMKE